MPNESPIVSKLLAREIVAQADTKMGARQAAVDQLGARAPQPKRRR